MKSTLTELKRNLKRGEVYRRSDLSKWSKSVDRDLDLLMKDGTLKRFFTGLYYFPRKSEFGEIPPKDETLIRGFLRNDRFLLFSQNEYNSLGVGTTQVYIHKMVYNRKQYTDLTLCGKAFSFRIKRNFPDHITPEFLLVDLVNNLDTLAEDRTNILENVLRKADTMDAWKIRCSVIQYGFNKAKRVFKAFIV